MLLYFLSFQVLHANSSHQKELSLIITSDIHGWLSSSYFYPKRKAFGLLHLAQSIENYRQKNPHSIIVDAGDILFGSPLSQYQILYAETHQDNFFTALQSIKYDAIVVGNHDWEVFPYFKKNFHSMQDVWVSSNIQPKKFSIQPYKTLVKNGIKILIIGLTTTNISYWLDSSILAELKITDSYATLEKLKQAIQEERADLIIGLFHITKGPYRNYVASINNNAPRHSSLYQILEEHPIFDIVVAGHDHRLSPKNKTQPLERIRGIPIIQPGHWGKSFTTATISLDTIKEKMEVTDIEIEVHQPVNTPEIIDKYMKSLPEEYITFMEESTTWKYKTSGEYTLTCLNTALNYALSDEVTTITMLTPLRLKPLYLKKGEYIKRKHLFYWLPYPNTKTLVNFSSLDLHHTYNNNSVELKGNLSNILSLPQTIEKNIPVVVANYHANGGKGLLASLFIERNYIIKKEPMRIRDIFMEYLKKTPASER